MPSEARILGIARAALAAADAVVIHFGGRAGALGVPIITPFLPGAVFSRQVWASTLWHRGVTIAPSLYSYDTLTAEIFVGRTDIINSIPPEDLAAVTISCLQALS